jgi:hypothetical protein
MEVVEKMKRTLLLVALVGSVALAVVNASSGATVRGITPFVASGYPSCAQVGFGTTESATFSPPVNGASSNGLFLLVDSSTSFGWYVLPEIRDVHVRAIIVKGGPNSNVYVYSGADYSDGPITAPRNSKNGNLYGVGSATFCFNVAS